VAEKVTNYNPGEKRGEKKKGAQKYSHNNREKGGAPGVHGVKETGVKGIGNRSPEKEVARWKKGNFSKKK